MDKNGNHLAIASVPCQKWKSTYEPEAALKKGTIFPELNMPFSRRMMGTKSHPPKGIRRKLTQSSRRGKLF